MLNKILANKIQTYFEKITHHAQVEFIPKMQGWFNIIKAINVINNIRDRKHTIVSKDTGKSL